MNSAGPVSSRICWQSMALRYASSDGTRLPGTCTRLGAKAISISNRKLQDCHEYNVARFFSTHNRDYVPKAGCPFVLPKRVRNGTKSCVPTTATKRQQGLASVFNTRLWLRKHTWKQHRRAARNAGPTLSTCRMKNSFRNQSLHDPSFSSEYLPAPGVCRASCAATGVLWGVTEKSVISNCTCKQATATKNTSAFSDGSILTSDGRREKHALGVGPSCGNSVTYEIFTTIRLPFGRFRWRFLHRSTKKKYGTYMSNLGSILRQILKKHL